MSRGRRFLVRGIALGALVGLGVAAGFVWGERRAASKAGESREPPPSPSPALPRASEEPLEVTLTPEAVTRAGIKTAVVRSQASTTSMTVPGTVTSNAYRDTRVAALVGGVVRGVSAELGSRVSRGQPLAVIISAELADGQMRYLSMQAMLVADHQKRARAEKLVALGAASRQELEEVTALHAAHETEVAAARQRLLLLGLSATQVAALQSAADIVSDVTVAAPVAGTVIARSANPGQVVTAGQELFVVTDLSTVWVIGDLYEKDFGSVRVGAPAAVSVPAESWTIRGRVAYIDPRVDPATRTAKVRVEVPNPAGTLRLGMFANVSFDAPSREAVPVLPRSAVQSIGERTVVYVASDGDAARFIERTVKLGSVVGESVEVLEGLKPGERVVVEGSFFMRAEAARTRTTE